MKTRGATILVIDDDVSVQMFVTKVLRNEGYDVVVAADVNEALHMSDTCTSPIRLILTDIMLPTSNGMALAQALVEKHPGTPVLYMSGAGSEAIHALQFEGAPIGEFLQKPFSPTQLVNKVHAMIADNGGASGSVRDAGPALFPEADVLRQKSDAVYRLESPVRCAHCGETVSTLQAVRLLRTHVNFTSTLPRRGRVLVCPRCAAIVSADLTSF